MDAIKVSDEGLVANLYLPSAEGKHPLVIVLSGSDADQDAGPDVDASVRAGGGTDADQVQEEGRPEG